MSVRRNRISSSLGLFALAASMVSLTACDAAPSAPVADAGDTASDAGVTPSGDSGPGIADAGGSLPGVDAGSPPPPPVDAGTPSVGCGDDTVAACAAPITMELPVSFSGTTSGTDTFGGSMCGRGGDGVNDLAVYWTAKVAGTYDITTTGSSFDTVLSIRRGCGGAEVICNDDVRSGVLQSGVTVELAECETVVIVVDGYDAASTGSVRISITGREASCDNGVDDDGDGASDCEDSDCAADAACASGDWPPDWQAFEREVLVLTNGYRAAGASCASDRFGPAPALEMDGLIRRAARGHSEDMGRRNYFEHDSLDGRSFADRMRDTGFSGASPWGENIAAGQTTPREVVDGWMTSPGHCRNIMNPDFRTIGVGYAFEPGSRFGHYWTQDFAAGH